MAHRSVPVIGPTGIPPLPKIPKAKGTVQTIMNFLYYLNHRDLTGLMSTFSIKNNWIAYPRVGITSYGPQFIGYNAVQRLFRQLIISFDPIAMTPQYPFDPTNPGEHWLYNNAQTEIGIHMNFSGLQVASWFAEGTPYFSSPLSNIDPDATRAFDLDAFVVFSFDENNNNIVQAAAYFDRYLMSQHLATD